MVAFFECHCFLFSGVGGWWRWGGGDSLKYLLGGFRVVFRHCLFPQSIFEQGQEYIYFLCLVLIIIIYFLTTRVVAASQMISQPVFCISPCSPLPSGTWLTPGLFIRWCCLYTSSSVCLVSSPFHCALQDGIGQTWWTGDMTIPLHLRLFTSL